MPEELARVQNPTRTCEVCGEFYVARNNRQKYCGSCRVIVDREQQQHYYETKGAIKRKRARRAERARRGIEGLRKCKVLRCENMITGAPQRKYCKACRNSTVRRQKLSEPLPAPQQTKNDATASETQRDTTETNDT